MDVLRLPGVFAPRSDTWLLRDRMLAEDLAGSTVLELCTGPGAVAVAAAQRGATVTAVDIGILAVLSARFNAARAGVSVDVRRGDLFEPVAGMRFDLIIANPPYVPSPRERPPRRASARCWDGGLGGRMILDRLIRGLSDHLEPGGRALIVHSSHNDVDRTLAELRRTDLEPRVVDRCRGPLGPLMRRSTGAGADDPDHEDLVVVRADRPS